MGLLPMGGYPEEGSHQYCPWCLAQWRKKVQEVHAWVERLYPPPEMLARFCRFSTIRTASSHSCRLNRGNRSPLTLSQAEQHAPTALSDGFPPLRSGLYDRRSAPC
ncbi:unnamed protein product [Ectocarpus sp. 12 AP-2014]